MSGLLSWTFFPASAQEALPYVNGFEEADGMAIGDLNGQRGWTVDRGEATVEDTLGYEGSRAVRVAPSTPSGQISLRLQRPAGSVVYSDFLVKPIADEANDEGAWVAGQFADVEGSIAGFFRVDAAGYLYVLDSDGNGEGTWMIAGSLYVPEDQVPDYVRLTIRQDYLRKVWDIFVNGELRLADLGLWDETAEYLGTFSLMGHTAHPLLIDELTIDSKNMLFPDADNDGIADAVEQAHGGDLDRTADEDGDGMNTIAELLAGTDYHKADSDDDGLHDADEIAIGRDPLKIDYFTAEPSEDEFKKNTPLPLRFGAPRATLSDERRTAAAMLMAFEERASKDDLSLLESYLEEVPTSAFHPWVQANLGFLHYRQGRFSEAFKAFRAFWPANVSKEPEASADAARWDELLNEVGVLYSNLCAHFGKKEELATVLSEVRKRPLDGVDRNALLNAGVALTMLETQPERASNCGAIAVFHLHDRLRGWSQEHSKRIASATKGPVGFNFNDVEELARSAGLNYRVAQWAPGQALPVPSIVHWKEGHFALVTEKRDDLYWIDDPAFEKRFYVSEKTLMEESEGHFLVEGGAASQHLTSLDRAKAADLRGRSGYFYLSTKDDPCYKSCGCVPGMAGYGIDHFRGGFYIQDTPLWVENPLGPTIDFKVTYTRTGQRQPKWEEMSHFGKKEWFLNWASVVKEDDSVGYQGTLELWLPDGRKESYVWVSGNTYKANFMSGATLTRVTSPSTHYIRTQKTARDLCIKR